MRKNQEHQQSSCDAMAASMPLSKPISSGCLPPLYGEGHTISYDENYEWLEQQKTMPDESLQQSSSEGNSLLSPSQVEQIRAQIMAYYTLIIRKQSLTFQQLMMAMGMWPDDPDQDFTRSPPPHAPIVTDCAPPKLEVKKEEKSMLMIPDSSSSNSTSKKLLNEKKMLNGWATHATEGYEIFGLSSAGFKKNAGAPLCPEVTTIDDDSGDETRNLHNETRISAKDGESGARLRIALSCQNKGIQQRTKTSSYPRQCVRCNRMIFHRSTWSTHTKRDDCQKTAEKAVKNNLEKLKKYICHHKGCGKVYYSHRSFSSHIKTHEPTERVTCQDCKKSLSRVSLKSHRRRCTGGTKLECDRCKGKFISRSSIASHFKWCEPENQKKYVCLYKGCDRVYGKRSSFHKHKKTHERITYGNSQRDFLTRSHQKDHERRCNGVKKFKCYYCQRMFADRPAIIFHLNDCKQKKLSDKKDVDKNVSSTSK